MKRTFRKQTHNDFAARVQRLDPQYAAKSPKARIERKPWEVGTDKSGDTPIMMGAFGFVLAIGGVLALQDQAAVRDLMLQWGWPATYIGYVSQLLAVCVIALVVVFLANIARIFNRNATGRKNAGGWVLGSLAAIVAVQMPQQYWDSGYAFVELKGAAVYEFAQVTSVQLAEVDWSSVVAVSSRE